MKKTITDPKQLGLMTQSFLYNPKRKHLEAVCDVQSGKTLFHQTWNSIWKPALLIVTRWLPLWTFQYCL